MKHTVDFFVHSKSTRSGFMHRACAIGPLPRLDEKSEDYGEYRRNDDELFSKRYAKVSYCNRTWESYSGQTCLARLWDQLSELKFLDMGDIRRGNPFADGSAKKGEPKHEDLYEPDELFGRFGR
jgi:hypothetical protein